MGKYVFYYKALDSLYFCERMGKYVFYYKVLDSLYFWPQRPMTSDFEGFSIPDFIHYTYFPILILEKEPVFSLMNVQC